MRRGELEALPIADAELDAATLLLVLHHLPDPVAALAEAARVLRPGGRLLICDMLPHDREEYRQQMGHVWLGFGEDALQRLLTTAGFERHPYRVAASRSRREGPGAVRRRSREAEDVSVRQLPATGCQLPAEDQNVRSWNLRAGS